MKINSNIFFLICFSDEIAKPRKPGYKPPDPRLLEKARDVRLKEIKMWGIVREILFYSFFLWILMVISYRNRSYMSYYYKASLEKVFITTNDTKHHFLKVRKPLKDCICIDKYKKINSFSYNYNLSSFRVTSSVKYGTWQVCKD